MIKSMQDLMEFARERGPKTVAVACAQDLDVLKAVTRAKESRVADAILVGDQNKIEALASENSLDLSSFEIINIVDMMEASLKAVELVSSGKAHMVMKGLVDTSIFLKAVLNAEIGLRTGNVLSHVAVFDIKGFDRLFLVTDAAMNIDPDLETKKQIIENAVVVAKALDIEEPKVASICAKEKANPKMPDTMDAAALTEMNEKGELKGCLVGGPFALDNAVSEEAARIKGIEHPVAGKADILLAPDIEGGNILYKTLGFMMFASNAAVIVGAKAPIVLTSRADSDESKLNSIALGVLCAAKLF
ncbi:phosphate butyryltransferase [Tindallia magadiensis]|uniref:Phosphate butyryltransferase n=1 Tax=Tindallia magadiensis TaxID=69895 RepID=A0A1I3FL82_9FIRM|nr:phosphate butyryltransferase [Tindallia magadiensis]SFI11872.1 phosphate butyryltransferase [Tindallia magadiensis]